MRVNSVGFKERKSRFPKNAFLAILYILVILIVAVGVLSIISGFNLTHPKKIETPQITSNIAPDYRNVSFYCIESKEKLNGWYFNALGSKNTVLIVHGYGQNRLPFGEDTFKLISMLNDKGYNVMTYDLRGAGNSSGSISTFGKNEKIDVMSAIKYLKQQGTQNIIILGYSTGASASLSALLETPYRDSIAGIIADSPYSKVDNFITDLISEKTHYPSFPFDHTIKLVVKQICKADSSLDIISKIPDIIPTPVLFIDGQQENFRHYGNTKLLYEMYSRKHPTTAYYWNSGATDYLGSYMKSPDEYMDRIMEFIELSLSKSEVVK